MATIVDLLLINQLTVLAVAVLLWIGSKSNWLSHRPVLVHSLWLLVLLKLVTPPLVGLPFVPNAVADVVEWETTYDVPPKTAEAVTLDTALLVAPSSHPVPPPETIPSVTDGSGFAPVNLSRRGLAFGPTNRPHVFLLLMIGSLLVSAGIILFACRQALTIGRLLRELPSPSVREEALLREVSQRLNQRNPPRLLIVDEAISPMLWVGLSDSAIVLPRELMHSVSDEQLRQIFAHELAHRNRRDYLTNMVAFLISSLFWWNPVAWFARRQLHAAAEACSDAIAIKCTAGSRRAYASTLLEVVEFLSSNKSVRPTAAMSFGHLRFLKRRVAMIANDKVQSCLTRRLLLLLFAAGSSLPMVPAMAQQEPQLSSSPKSQEEDSKNGTSERGNDAKSDRAGFVDQAVRQPPPAADESHRTGVRFDSETTLEAGVERFNAQVRRLSERRPGEIALDQPPLTADEVVASIRSWDTKRNPVDPLLLAVFQKIAKSRKLPAGSELDFTTKWTPNSTVEFTVWWVNLNVSAPNPEKEGSRVGYAFRVRDRRISSRLILDADVAESLSPLGSARQKYIARHFDSFLDTNTAP